MSNMKERVHFLDTIRGIIIIGVVAYHFLFDLYDIFGVNIPWMFSWWTNLVRDAGAGILIIISGISCHLSRNNTKRGLKAIAVALIISVVTYFVIPEEFIFFGIIHFLGICMLAYDYIFKHLNKLNRIAGTIVCAVLFLLTYNVYSGYMGFEGLFTIELPSALYGNFVSYIAGFGEGSGFFSADYYPFLPWIFLFIIGVFLGNYVKERRVPEFFYKDYIPPVTYIGTKTIIIYVLHQPLLFGLLSLIFNVMA